MNHNNKNQPSSPEPADLAMKQVLQAERDAEQVVADCEQEARDILKSAQQQAQRIAARANERISMLQMRHNQKLNQTIKAIEQAGHKTEQAEATAQFDAAAFNTIIDDLAVELTTSDSDANTDQHT